MQFYNLCYFRDLIERFKLIRIKKVSTVKMNHWQWPASSKCSFKTTYCEVLAIQNITEQFPHDQMNFPLRTISRVPSASNTVQMGLIKSKMAIMVRKYPSNLMCRSELFTPEKTCCVQAAEENRVSAVYSCSCICVGYFWIFIFLWKYCEVTAITRSFQESSPLVMKSLL